MSGFSHLPHPMHFRINGSPTFNASKSLENTILQGFSRFDRNRRNPFLKVFLPSFALRYSPAVPWPPCKPQRGTHIIIIMLSSRFQTSAAYNGKIFFRNVCHKEKPISIAGPPRLPSHSVQKMISGLSFVVDVYKRKRRLGACHADSVRSGIFRRFCRHPDIRNVRCKLHHHGNLDGVFQNLYDGGNPLRILTGNRSPVLGRRNGFGAEMFLDSPRWGKLLASIKSAPAFKLSERLQPSGSVLSW